ncbi:MAG: phage tail tube protein [Pseudomonadota bacterium]
MAAVRGTEVLIKRGNGADPEVFTTVGAIRNATITINGNPIDVTTADDVDGNNEIWRTSITGVKDFSISGDGVAKALLPVQTVYNDFATGAITNYEVVAKWFGTWTVAMIVTNMTIEGPYDGAETFSIELQAAGAPTFVAET